MASPTRRPLPESASTPTAVSAFQRISETPAPQSLAATLSFRHLSASPPTAPVAPPPLESSVRLAAVSWLLELSAWYARHPQTVHHAVSYLDQYFALNPPEGANVAHYVQLVACASFLIACKMLEEENPSLKDLSDLSAGACSQEDILEVEMMIVNSLGWNMIRKTPHDVLKFLCGEAGAGSKNAEGGSKPDSTPKKKLRENPQKERIKRSSGVVITLFADETLDDLDDSDDGALQTPYSKPVVTEGMSPCGTASRTSGFTPLKSKEGPEAPRKSKTKDKLQEFCVAFADVALHNWALQNSFSAGEIAAACLILGRCAVARTSKNVPPKDLWLSNFTNAGLSFESVLNAAALILSAWERALHIRTVAGTGAFNTKKSSAEGRSRRKTLVNLMAVCDYTVSDSTLARNHFYSLLEDHSAHRDRKLVMVSPDCLPLSLCREEPSLRDTFVCSLHSILLCCKDVGEGASHVQRLPLKLLGDLSRLVMLLGDAKNPSLVPTDSPLSCASADKENIPKSTQESSPEKPFRRSSRIAAKKRTALSNRSGSPPAPKRQRRCLSTVNVNR